ncbi:hypothetical protein [Hymenobacter sp. PAMC 26628]|uniref:hypothetical protein n=1 Tax=Hymenobacter sp. PAMC 26628 TaxID=1484118 RepID=UPI0007701D70|nr:hypothetical protein [Hymenobacter sp. PAMC 26628]AMJ65954.1 hypothetical protein AXW84_11315 [Hymenobacter sp. PAMC 26628]
MKPANKPYIVVIDDDVHKEDYPLIDFIERAYGEERVKLFEEPKDGVDFVKAHLSERIIVVLDIMFDGQAIGFDVFDQIIEESVLVCIIVMTGSLESTKSTDLQKLINGHAWYLVGRDESAKSILKLIKDAEDHLSMRVDGALEEWVLRQNAEDQKKPFITSKEGKTYSLLDILRAIRTEDDEVAKKLVKSITSTAIDILSRDKSRIGN